MSNKQLISQEVAARTVEDALRLRVGRGRRHSFDGLAEASGIPLRTLESYVQGSTPGLGNLLTLCSLLGSGFTSDILRCVGQAAREADPDAPHHARALTALTAVAAQLAAALEDGALDHREKAQLRPAALNLIALLDPIARGGSDARP